MPFESSLTKQHFATALITSILAGVAFYSFAVFWYYPEALTRLFFADLQTDDLLPILHLLCFHIVGFLGIPIGGVLIGIYGDRKGRKPALYLSLAIGSLASLVIALLPTYEHIGIVAPFIPTCMRLLQGVAIGGIFPSAWVFVTEHLPIKRLGVACGLTLSSRILGLIIAGMTFEFFDNYLQFHQMLNYGWRISFGMGAVLLAMGLLTYFITQETPVFIRSQTQPPNASATINTISLHDSEYSLTTLKSLSRSSRLDVIRSNFLPSFLPAMVLSAVIASLVIFLPLLLLPIIEFSTGLTATTLRFGGWLGMFFMVLGCGFFGFLADITNAGRVLIFGSLLLIIQAAIFIYQLQAASDFILASFALLGFSAGLIGAIPAIIIRLFPAKIRLFGTAATFGIIYAFVGGIIPLALGLLTYHLSYIAVLYIILVAIVTIFMSFYIYYIPRSDNDLLR